LNYSQFELLFATFSGLFGQFLIGHSDQQTKGFLQGSPFSISIGLVEMQNEVVSISEGFSLLFLDLYQSRPFNAAR
jgi:hypothetical protein